MKIKNIRYGTHEIKSIDRYVSDIVVIQNLEMHTRGNWSTERDLFDLCDPETSGTWTRVIEWIG